MTTKVQRHRWRTGISLSAASLLALALNLSAQSFRIENADLDDQGRFRVAFPSDAAFYYLLERGSAVTNIDQVHDIVLGTNGTGLLLDSNSVTVALSGFYRVIGVPISAPLDTDGDGIDDVWELRFRHPGAALNGADAHEDHTETGRSDLEDYLAQSPPLVASFAVVGSQFMETAGAVGVEVRFSRFYTGVLKFQIGGTAIEGRDFQPGFNKPLGELLTGAIPVEGTSATIPLTLLTNDFIDMPRSLVFSLQQPATTGSYHLGALSTHTLIIAEGDRGVFGGVISFTNGAAVGPQSVKFALRSGANGGTAFFDTSGATFFGRRPFSIPVQFSGIAAFVPLGSADGVLSSETLGRTVNWNLEFGQPTLVTETLTANVILRLSGLSVSGSDVIARGVMVANRLDIAP